MIEFQLDETSGVATYLQLVQQVHQALRMGMLEPGDQLPTAQQVHHSLAGRNRPGHAGTVPRRDDRLATLGTIGGPRPRRHRGDLPHRVPRLLRRRGGMMTAVIEANGLGKQYRRTWALRDCTLAIPDGRVVGLVGPNGAGKTTLLQLATGLLTPTRGTISVLGEHPAASPAQLTRVGFVAQDTPVYSADRSSRPQSP
jgi:ABC-type multidrug transport system fused ATPase/permease subunit